MPLRERERWRVQLDEIERLREGEKEGREEERFIENEIEEKKRVREKK